MNQKIRTITAASALSLGLFLGCSSMNDVAKTNNLSGNGRYSDSEVPIFGQPGVDFPSPHYVGEMNSNPNYGRFRYYNRSATDQVGHDHFDDTVPEYGFEEDDAEYNDRDYVIGGSDRDWNRDRNSGGDTVRSRSGSARTAKVVNKAPVGEMYDQVAPFPADETVNVANLADADLISRFHMANLREIELGRIAQERANSEWVRALGRRVAMDNQYTDRRLMRLTRRLEMNVPGDVAASNASIVDTSSLDQLTGVEFDREILRRLSSAQQEKMMMLESAQAQMPQDSRLRELVSTFIPITEQHVKVAANISSKYLDRNI